MKLNLPQERIHFGHWKEWTRGYRASRFGGRECDVTVELSVHVHFLNGQQLERKDPMTFPLLFPSHTSFFQTRSIT